MITRPQRSYTSAADGSAASAFMWLIVFVVMSLLSGVIVAMTSASLFSSDGGMTPVSTMFWGAVALSGASSLGALVAFARTVYVLLDRSDRNWKGE